MNKFNCRGQIGETMTWIVATLIIIVILGISIFVVSSGSFENDKTIKQEDIDSDLLVTKSLLGYLLTDNNFEKFENREVPANQVVSFSGENFAREVFVNLHKQEYPKVSDFFYFGVLSEYCAWNKETHSNLYCRIVERSDVDANCNGVFYDNVKLNNGNVVELMVGCRK